MEILIQWGIKWDVNHTPPYQRSTKIISQPGLLLISHSTEMGEVDVLICNRINSHVVVDKYLESE